MRFKIENPKPTLRIPAGQKMGNCSDRQTVASCLIFSMSSILLPKSPTILWIGDLGKNLWFQTRFHEFSPQGGARQTRDSIIFFKGFDGSIMQLDNPIIYFVKLYMNCWAAAYCLGCYWFITKTSLNLSEKTNYWRLLLKRIQKIVWIKMTISYQNAVASSTAGGFTRLLFKWKGSLYKLIYRELLLFITAYIMLSLVYRQLLTKHQKS